MITPWLKWDDGEPVGWTVCWRYWKAKYLPYRTIEFLGYDEETLEVEWGETKWHRPMILRRKRA